MNRCEVQPEIPENFKELEKYPGLLKKLLFYRGLKKTSEADYFLNPEYKPHNPFLMKDMDKAVERLIRAIVENERVAIFSDYDADGIPGAVVINDFFKKIGFENFEVYIPNRHTEGFGLNDEAMKELSGRGTKILITVDCGMADLEEVALAKKLGMDVIITDHHVQNGKLPPAFAILNPKQEDCGYPEKMLCGAAVAFKLVQAMLAALRGERDVTCSMLHVPFLGWEKWLLDMVGLATLSDQVPLTGENRIFAKYGLAVLRKTPRVGLRELFNLLNIKMRELTEDDIGFSISPRINAASRMGEPADAFKMLSTPSLSEAVALAKHLQKMNDERKGAVAAMMKEIKHAVVERYSEEKKVIVVGNPNWKPALLGLAAGVAAEEYSCPVFLWGRSEKMVIKGSCRSFGGVSVLEVMKKVSSEILLEFGGHELAGGFSVNHEKIHLFPEELKRIFENMEGENEGTAGQKILVDSKLFLEDVNWNTWREIESLAPFGAGNPKPIFLFEGIQIKKVRSFGKENSHLEISFEKSGGEEVKAISFFTKASDFDREIADGQRVNLAATMEKSLFRNFPELRLRVVDVF